MIDLNFSDEITLSDNQRGSVVVDGIGEKEPVIGNYGCILKEENGAESTYIIKMVRKTLNIDRDLEAALTPQNTDANIELNTYCASNLKDKDIFNFTIKTFPHYGAYGYVNYKKGDAAVYKYGPTLNKTRGGGDIFNANK